MWAGPETRRSQDTDVGFVRGAGELRYQAILEDGRSLLDGPSAGGGGLPRNASPGSDVRAPLPPPSISLARSEMAALARGQAMAAIFAPPQAEEVEEQAEAEASR